MKTNLRLSLTLLTTLLATVVSAEIGFRPLELFKFEDGISRLQCSDIDRDGRADLIFLNNRDSRIEILFSKASAANPVAGRLPELDERFLNAGMIADQYVRDLTLSDVNADGLDDLITVGAAQGLNIRFQQPGRKFSEPVRIFIEKPDAVLSTQAADLDQDLRPDLLLLYREKAEILWNDESHTFRERSLIRFAKESASYAEFIAADPDANLDLLVYFNEKIAPLSLFKGCTNRTFSAEHPLLLPDCGFIHSLAPGGDPLHIGIILSNRRGYRLYRIGEEERPDPKTADQTTVRRIALDTTETARITPWITGDFNQDGYDDLISSAPQLSQLHLYHGTPDGLAAQPLRIDTLSEISSLQKLANGDLLVVSQTEKAAARHKAKDYKAFPQLIQTGSDVLAGTADANDTLYLICKSGDKLTLHIQPENDRVTTIPLDLKNDPSRLLAFSLSEKETGLLIFIPYEKPLMFIQNGKKLTPVDATRFPALNRELKPENFLFDADGSGCHITVAADRMARVFEWDGTAYTIQRQINPESEQASIKTLTRCGDDIVLYNEQDASLLFNRPDNSLHRLHLRNPSAAIGALTSLSLAGRQTLVLISPNALNEVINGESYELTAEAEYTTQAEDPSLNYAVPVTVGAEQKMIAVVDSANSTLELLENNGTQITNNLTFKVFETPQLADTKKKRAIEPHSVTSGDLNGDGLSDLALLCHDRLLLYFSE